MQLEIDWRPPCRLLRDRHGGLIYTVDLDRIPDTAGIYIFAREYAKSFEALYVGKSTNLRKRTRQQLTKNVRLMRHVETAKAGKRWVFAGEVVTKPGQQLSKVLATVERSFIRHYLAEGHDLVNQQGTKIRRHEIESFGRVRRSFIPSSMFVER